MGHSIHAISETPAVALLYYEEIEGYYEPAYRFWESTHEDATEEEKRVNRIEMQSDDLGMTREEATRYVDTPGDFKTYWLNLRVAVPEDMERVKPEKLTLEDPTQTPWIWVSKRYGDSSANPIIRDDKARLHVYEFYFRCAVDCAGKTESEIDAAFKAVTGHLDLSLEEPSKAFTSVACAFGAERAYRRTVDPDRLLSAGILSVREEPQDEGLTARLGQFAAAKGTPREEEAKDAVYKALGSLVRWVPAEMLLASPQTWCVYLVDMQCVKWTDTPLYHITMPCELANDAMLEGVSFGGQDMCGVFGEEMKKKGVYNATLRLVLPYDAYDAQSAGEILKRSGMTIDFSDFCDYISYGADGCLGYMWGDYWGPRYSVPVQMRF